MVGGSIRPRHLAVGVIAIAESGRGEGGPKISNQISALGVEASIAWLKYQLNTNHRVQHAHHKHNIKLNSKLTKLRYTNYSSRHRGDFLELS